MSAVSRSSSGCSRTSGRSGSRWLIVLVPSFVYKKRLGLYGQLFDSGVGIVGVVICFFWLFTAIFAATIAPSIRSARSRS